MEDLKFSSANEALQHLADLTGKSIKIAADKKYSLNVTYSITTEESAAEGDYAETGFEEEGKEFDSLYEMIDYMINEGASEASNSSYSYPNTWYSTVDPSYDRAYFEKGEDKQLSFHPEGITKEEGQIIFDSIKKGTNLAMDPDDSDEFDMREEVFGDSE